MLHEKYTHIMGSDNDDRFWFDGDETGNKYMSLEVATIAARMQGYIPWRFWEDRKEQNTHVRYL
jgi:hypothetical protein